MGRPQKEPDLSTFTGQIAAQIRKRREKLNLSIEEAAGRAKMPASTWYQCEDGRHLRLERLPPIAAALKCRPKDLLP